MKNTNLLGILLVFLFVLPFQLAFCQKPPLDDDFMEYDARCAEMNFQSAIHLEQVDSIQSAMMYFAQIVNYDSSSVLGRIALSKINAVWKPDSIRFREQLTGNWKWLWSGSNWGTANSPEKCSCEKYYEFKNNQILVVSSDVPTEVLTFEIEKNNYLVGSRLFFLKIKERNETWRVEVSNNTSEDAYYLSYSWKRSKNTKLLLNVMTDLGCACGCPELGFEKVEN